ncbi:MAG: hypothetical protein K9M99_13110 [Candidatus Cloacimonetes bacterium]|nr:hypothetical protein [Candidatus Cloacimonadota bacterium]
MKLIKYLSLVVLAFIAGSCSKNNESAWTVLVYMAADNSLNFEAAADMADMMQAEFSDELNLIVQIDYSAADPQSGAYRYHIFPSISQQISYLGEIDSGDGDQLTAFANWGFEKYPSSNQALIIWSHGNGWYPKARDIPPSLCPDVEADDYINISGGELRQAITNINEHLEILLFDACNMQTVEVAAEISDQTDFIIASEGGVNSDGFPYAEIFSKWEEQTSVQNITREIGYQYYQYYFMQEIYPIACSVLKTSMFDLLLAALTDFTADWSSFAGDDVFTQGRQSCLEFNAAGFTNPALDVDIKEFFTYINANAESDSLFNISSEILTTIEDCYIFQKTDDFPTGYTSDDVGSALIWFPDDETQWFFEDRKVEYQLLKFSQTNWLDFLENSFTN